MSGRRRARLVVFSGLPGTGKSALAERVSAALGDPVLSVDPIEQALVASGVRRGFETGLAAYTVCAVIAEMQLARGQGAIIDAVNAVEPAKEMWRRLWIAYRLAPIVVECILLDERLHRRRLRTRVRGLAIPEPTWEEVRRRRREFTPWREPALVVDGVEPLERNARRVLAWIRKGGIEAAVRSPPPPVRLRSTRS